MYLLYFTIFVPNDIIINTNGAKKTAINEVVWHSLPGNLSIL